MLTCIDPREAYRRSEIEARVRGVTDQGELVGLCLEQVIGGLGLAIIAYRRADAATKSKALSRALSALIALDMGVDHVAPLASALLQFYGAGRKAILDSVVSFDCDRLGRLREDFIEIKRALKNA